MFSMLPPAQAWTYKPSHQFNPNRQSPLSSLPLRSSPLSPRDTNVPTRSSPNTIMSSPPSAQYSKPSVQSSPPLPCSSFSTSSRQLKAKPSRFAKRPIKTNPLFQGRNADDGRETRRKLFLKKVREESEEKKWQARGGDDEIMRMIWVAEERRRVEKREREARGLGVGSWEGEVDSDGDAEGIVMSQERDVDEAMADEIARREQEELEALVVEMQESSMEEQSTQPAIGSMGSASSHVHQEDATQAAETPYGSDEEYYDKIFMELSMQEPGEHTEHEMMDMS